MDVYTKQRVVDEEVVKNLGPLAGLAGVWQGARGVDIAPSAKGPVETKFREEINFEPMGPVENGPQVLYGLRYSTVAWPLGEEKAFHEEVGYWLWDPGARHVMRCFIVPRGITVNAGGTSNSEARAFELVAEVGSEIYGITSNPFLDESFKTIRYELQVTLHGDDSFSYREDSQLKIHGISEIFHHTDKNTLSRCP